MFCFGIVEDPLQGRDPLFLALFGREERDGVRTVAQRVLACEPS